MADENGIKINATIIGAVAFLIAQLVGGVIWVANLGARVEQIERSLIEKHIANQAQFSTIYQRLDRMDSEGTRALGRVEDRQMDVMKRLDRLEHGAH